MDPERTGQERGRERLEQMSGESHGRGLQPQGLRRQGPGVKE